MGWKDSRYGCCWTSVLAMRVSFVLWALGRPAARTLKLRWGSYNDATLVLSWSLFKKNVLSSQCICIFSWRRMITSTPNCCYKNVSIHTKCDNCSENVNLLPLFLLPLSVSATEGYEASHANSARSFITLWMIIFCSEVFYSISSPGNDNSVAFIKVRNLGLNVYPSW
jgi:hypothetical protein